MRRAESQVHAASRLGRGPSALAQSWCGRVDAGISVRCPLREDLAASGTRPAFCRLSSAGWRAVAAIPSAASSAAAKVVRRPGLRGHFKRR